jgi:hypothetical protein
VSRKLSHQPLPDRFNHLLNVISSQRFLEMKGLNNDLPFYVCEYKPAEAIDMDRMRRQLASHLAAKHIECLGGRGVQVLEINLYDLCIELLKGREGSEVGTNVWNQTVEIEIETEKDRFLEHLQTVLDVEVHVIPAIAAKLDATDFDVLFLSGIGEVFPYIRSHNVLNNLQSTAKTKPTMMFFPGEYRFSLEHGASLELFGLLHDDKYYRAFNIFETQA